MLALGVGAALGIMPFACIALAGYLWALTIRDFLTGWLGVRSEPADPAGRLRRTRDHVTRVNLPV